MSNIIEKIDNDLKQAMINKDELSLSVLRMLRSSLRNKEISLRSGGSAALSDEQVMEVINSELKKRKDSIEAYTAGNRADLAEREKAEMGILEKYLPAQLSDEELEAIIRGVVEKAEVKDFGRLMGMAMPHVKEKADGGRVGAMLKKILG